VKRDSNCIDGGELPVVRALGWRATAQLASRLHRLVTKRSTRNLMKLSVKLVRHIGQSNNVERCLSVDATIYYYAASELTVKLFNSVKY
jgi:hypothetical protein